MAVVWTSNRDIPGMISVCCRGCNVFLILVNVLRLEQDDNFQLNSVERKFSRKYNPSESDYPPFAGIRHRGLCNQYKP